MSYNPYSLKGKTIMITGASSGIGRATAIECSKLGANLIICGRNVDKLEETLLMLDRSEHQSIVGDLTEQSTLEIITDNIFKINGVVLCAGKGGTLPFKFSSREKFEEIWDINFFSPIELLRLLIKKKKIEKFSSIVFVSSIGGVYTHEVGNVRYGASKAAINSTMKYCANEFASNKIRVNSVNPGMVNTPLIQRGTLTEEQFKSDMELYPLKRYGEPKEIALGIIYLLSDASSWITGHSLVIDGGRTI